MLRDCEYWIERHDKEGWPPGEEDYEKRMRCKVAYLRYELGKGSDGSR